MLCNQPLYPPPNHSSLSPTTVTDPIYYIYILLILNTFNSEKVMKSLFHYLIKKIPTIETINWMES